LYTSGEFDKLT